MREECFVSDTFDIFSSDQNLSVIRVIETGNQCGNRAFTRAGGAYNGDFFAFADAQVAIFKHICFAVIGKAHAF